MHIPFCQRKCAYCDFISFSAAEKTRENYLNCLLQEMDLYEELLKQKRVTSLYLGGGTPSLLSEKELEFLLDGIFHRVHPQGELNIEVNPESMTTGKLNILRKHGDFRFSLGAQSFDPKVLELFGRNHTAEQIFEVFLMLRKEGVKRISLDFIYAIGDSYSMDQNLKMIEKLMPEHLSFYALELHPHRPLSKHLMEPQEEIYQRDFQEIKERLGKLGYHRYEISSFCKEGEESQHNLLYWRGEDYLGLGLAAHGFLNPYRYANVQNLKTYCSMIQERKKPIDYGENLSEAELRFERFMLGLRQVAGINLEEEGLLPLSPQEMRAMDKHVRNGLLIHRGDQLRFSDQGFDLSNYVLVDFLEK